MSGIPAGGRKECTITTHSDRATSQRHCAKWEKFISELTCCMSPFMPAWKRQKQKQISGCRGSGWGGIWSERDSRKEVFGVWNYSLCCLRWGLQELRHVLRTHRKHTQQKVNFTYELEKYKWKKSLFLNDWNKRKRQSTLFVSNDLGYHSSIIYYSQKEEKTLMGIKHMNG